MKSLIKLTATLLLVFMINACASTSIIRASAPHAKIYVNDEYIGHSPATYSDTKIAGSTSVVRIEAEGYDTLTTTIRRNEEINVGALVGTFFVLIPALWITNYRSNYSFDLSPESPTKVAKK